MEKASCQLSAHTFYSLTAQRKTLSMNTHAAQMSLLLSLLMQVCKALIVRVTEKLSSQAILPILLIFAPFIAILALQHRRIYIGGAFSTFLSCLF